MITVKKNNPVALITGSANRIGACIARHLHQQDYRVIIHYHSSAETAQKLVDELNQQRASSADAVKANLSEPEEVTQLAERAVKCFGQLDLLVNNASRFFATPMGEVTVAQWENLVNTNMRAPFFLAQALQQELAANNGCIINITDVYGHRPLEHHPVYSMTKAGLIMLTKSLSKEMGPEVRVNGVSPGAIIWPDSDLSDKRKSEILDSISLERIGGPDDIAETVAFLAKAGYVTGQVIAVDGGRLVQI
ncbi:MAG TPA: pteridine reductase [Gammaproteobacteria bacterium]|nr:pteridine reductase [Gammaproteobacteria bacterium]